MFYINNNYYLASKNYLAATSAILLNKFKKYVTYLVIFYKLFQHFLLLFINTVNTVFMVCLN